MAISFTNSGTITITLSSVANNAFATSSTIDNSSNKYWEAIIQIKIKTGASGTSTTGYYNVFLQRSADGGTTYDDTDKVLLGQIPAIANATTYIKSFSTAPFGALGSHWKISVENKAGGTTDTTAGNHSAVFTGVKYDA